MKITFLSILLVTGLSGCSQEVDNTDNIDDIELEVEQGFKPETIQFPSSDGIPIYAHVYEIHPDSPVILLCHQARFSKSEYDGIAQRLMDLGFNAIAIDQRSGGPIANQPNETTLAALAKDLPTDYLEAEKDITAAVNYTANRYKGPIILWGSSYSATLALYIAEKSKNVRAVVSFSPGDYFMEEKGSLIDVLAEFEKPMFVTSSNYEATQLSILMHQIGMNENQMQFIPEGEGHHGSRALWPTQFGGEEYWEAIEDFLEGLK